MKHLVIGLFLGLTACGGQTVVDDEPSQWLIFERRDAESAARFYWYISADGTYSIGSERGGSEIGTEHGSYCLIVSGPSRTGQLEAQDLADLRDLFDENLVRTYAADAGEAPSDSCGSPVSGFYLSVMEGVGSELRGAWFAADASARADATDALLARLNEVAHEAYEAGSPATDGGGWPTP